MYFIPTAHTVCKRQLAPGSQNLSPMQGDIVVFVDRFQCTVTHADTDRTAPEAVAADRYVCSSQTETH